MKWTTVMLAGFPIVCHAATSSGPHGMLLPAPCACDRRWHTKSVGASISHELLDKFGIGCIITAQFPYLRAADEWTPKALAAVRRKFDILMVWSIDRLGRSVLHVGNALAETEAARLRL